MYRRYFILTILLIPLFLTTPAATVTRLELSPVGAPEGPLIESRLAMEIESSSVGASAILEFEDILTDAEIQWAESQGISFVRRGSSIVNVGRIYSAETNDVAALSTLSELGLIRATSGTKQYVPSIASSVPAIGADEVWTNLNKNGGDVNGSGVTVAILDTGAKWTHPSFWRASPGVYQTRSDGPNYYVDLDNDSVPDSNEGPIRSEEGFSGSDFWYADDYMYINADGIPGFSYASGDRWIGGIDANDDDVITLGVESVVLLDVPKVAIVYDQENSNVYVRDVNLTLGVSVADWNGHGTHVASTVAGGQVGMTSYVGVAPGADLIIIESYLSSADILDGIAFAIENGADIINMSFSSYLGFLDGTDLEDMAVTEAFLRHGVMTVAAAGNMGDKSKHAHFSSDTGSIGTAMMYVSDPDPDDYPFLSLLWHSYDRDEHIILTPPGGEPIDIGAFSSIAQQSWPIDTEEFKGYVFTDINVRGLNNIIFQISDSEHNWENGVWNVTVTNEEGDPVWIDAYAWDGRWETNRLYFTTHVDFERTISSPATADLAIAVSAYDELSSGILSSSSKGPRIDGIPKPEVSAPGNNIRAAGDHTLWSERDGTSMASPHIAGVLALIRQAASTDSAWTAYSALVTGAGGTTDHYESASTSWGYGLTDPLWSVIQVIDSPGVDGSITDDWFGVETLFDDPIDASIIDGLDILSAKSFLDNDTMSLLVELRGTPDFQGSNVLSIGWDTDSNPSTGENGADILLNVTGGSSTVYDWNGSVYELSSLTADWWTDSSSVILRVDGVTLGTRGNISLRTHNSTMTNIDLAGPGTLTDFLWPVMTDISLESQDGSMLVHVAGNDRDSPKSLRTVSWSVVDGPLAILNSTSRAGKSEFTITIPENLYASDYLNSLTLNITSEGLTLHLPIMLLSTQFGTSLSFSAASLDRNIVRVGFLMNDLVTGHMTLDGFTLAAAVKVGFLSESGIWLNFTLTSSTGIYEFEISPTHFQLGSHEVYAIAIGQAVPGVEMYFATLTVVQDYTALAIGGGLAVACGAILFILRRRRGESV